MARRSVRFARSGSYVLNMLIFLIAVAAVVFYLSPYSPQPTNLLIEAFNANPALNGLILGVLLIGIIYNLRAASIVDPSARWVEAWAESPRSRLPRPPGLIRAMSQLLTDQYDRNLSPESTRAILDSVATRMDEGREMGRYIGNLLVFLGLLGTFWGLLQTVNAVGETIGGLADAGGAAEDAVAQLIRNLREPLSGMGTAFSSSLFGLGGSLIVGFLDIQASQAQGRFYTDLEDWLSGMTDTRLAAREGPRVSAAVDVPEGDIFAAIQSLEAALAANTEAHIKAQAGQTAELKDEIRALNRTLIRVGKGE